MARGLVEKLSDLLFLRYLFILEDLMAIILSLSHRMQSNDKMINAMKEELDQTAIQLTSLNTLHILMAENAQV